jgi:hypothetical protein
MEKQNTEQAASFTVESEHLVNISLMELFESSLELAHGDSLSHVDIAAVEQMELDPVSELVVIAFACEYDGQPGHGFFTATFNRVQEQYTFHDVEVAKVLDEGPMSAGYYVSGALPGTSDTDIYILYGYINDTDISRIEVDHRDGRRSTIGLHDTQRAYAAVSIGPRSRPDRITAWSAGGDKIYEQTI